MKKTYKLNEKEIVRYKKVLGQTIKLLRLTFGYKSKGLASELGISKSYLSEIESGNKIPTLKLIENLSIIFEINTSSFFRLLQELDACNKFHGDSKRKRITVLKLKILLFVLQGEEL